MLTHILAKAGKSLKKEEEAEEGEEGDEEEDGQKEEEEQYSLVHACLTDLNTPNYARFSNPSRYRLKRCLESMHLPGVW